MGNPCTKWSGFIEKCIDDFDEQQVIKTKTTGSWHANKKAHAVICELFWSRLDSLAWLLQKNTERNVFLKDIMKIFRVITKHALLAIEFGQIVYANFKAEPGSCLLATKPTTSFTNNKKN